MKIKTLEIILVLLLFFSGNAFVHDGHGHSDGGFDSPIFIVVFGGMGLGIYKSNVDGNKFSFLEASAAFFAGYFIFGFVFELLASVAV